MNELDIKWVGRTFVSECVSVYMSLYVQMYLFVCVHVYALLNPHCCPSFLNQSSAFWEVFGRCRGSSSYSRPLSLSPQPTLSLFQVSPTPSLLLVHSLVLWELNRRKSVNKTISRNSSKTVRHAGC